MRARLPLVLLVAGVVALGLGLAVLAPASSNTPAESEPAPADDALAPADDELAAAFDTLAARLAQAVPRVRPAASPKSDAADAPARQAFFERMLRDPATGRIPANVRARELAFARTLPTRTATAPGGTSGAGGPIWAWQEAGPYDVGGRTRALGIDRRNGNVLLAGGVSGGMWKSTDGGTSWRLTSRPAQQLSVTDLAQHPTNPDTWYYTTGEYRGNSARASGAAFRGTGLYRSTDNGETWNELAATVADPATYTSPFQYAARIVISPVTASLFVATNLGGVYRSDDDGASFALVTGPGTAPNGLAYEWADVAVGADGTLLAAFSSYLAGRVEGLPGTGGLFLSTDDGQSWTDITPAALPDGHYRPALAFAPSDPTRAYYFTTGFTSTYAGAEPMHFYALDLADPANVGVEDRSAAMPRSLAGVEYESYIGYCLTLAVKPDDPDFVVLGGVNLYRSRDGFRTPLTLGTGLIGGASYGPDDAFTGAQHPDQHVMVFDPANPNRMWNGNDGGLYRTSDVTAAGSVTWQSMNNGYNVTQFYDISQAAAAGDERLAGGTQDNGTPFFRADQPAAGSARISGGDGAYSFLTPTYAYTSAQGGFGFRFRYDAGGTPTFYDGLVIPPQAQGQLFIHPYTVNPNDDAQVFYPALDSLFRSNTAGNTWQRLTRAPDYGGCLVSAITATTARPAHRLYYALYCGLDAAPRLVRLDDADGAAYTATDISLPGAPLGAYVNDLAVNPDDGDELVVVHSNYNVDGLYHTADAGATYTSIEGNLLGDDAPGGTPGPSLRAAAIAYDPAGTGPAYLLGTSVGLFSTNRLAGAGTQWVQEAPTALGNAVVFDVETRASDLRAAVGTHGRGAFVGTTTALPVELTAFTATADAADDRRRALRLAWQTASETNNAGFEVQHQAPGAASFQAVGFVDGAGTTTDPQRYGLTLTTDAAGAPLTPGRHRVRLRQLDFDGAGETSAAVEVTLGVRGAAEVTAAYPNPLPAGQAARLTLTVADAQPVTVALYDATGRRVARLHEAPAAAGQPVTVRVPSQGLASGVYVVRVTGARFQASRRLVVVR